MNDLIIGITEQKSGRATQKETAVKTKNSEPNNVGCGIRRYDAIACTLFAGLNIVIKNFKIDRKELACAIFYIEYFIFIRRASRDEIWATPTNFLIRNGIRFDHEYTEKELIDLLIKGKQFLMKLFDKFGESTTFFVYNVIARKTDLTMLEPLTELTASFIDLKYEIIKTTEAITNDLVISKKFATLETLEDCDLFDPKYMLPIIRYFKPSGDAMIPSTKDDGPHVSRVKPTRLIKGRDYIISKGVKYFREKNRS